VNPRSKGADIYSGWDAMLGMNGYTGLCRRVWHRAGGAAHAPNGIVTSSGVSARFTCARVQHTTRRGGVARMSIKAAPEGQPVRRKRRQELRWRRHGQLEDDQLCL
jgi:hypothetical protein